MQVTDKSQRESTAESGERIYLERLQRILEPIQNGKLVAIYIPSGEYFVGQSLLDVSRRLRKTHKGIGPGDVYIRGIGDRAVIHARTPRATLS